MFIDAAYRDYIPRLGREPQPMTDDYTALIAAGEVWVLDGSSALDGILVVQMAEDYLLVRTVGIAPDRQRQGLGSLLMGEAEMLARAAEIHTLRLYTNEVMTGNVELYRRLGYTETHRTAPHRAARQASNLHDERADMTNTPYDLIIIGAGPGGYVAAIRAAQLGLKTACVEARETLGGTCLNVGCIPSKALLHASELYEEAHSGALAKFGVEFKSVSLNLDQMHAEKALAVKELTGGIEYLFKKNKVDWIKGAAAFTSANSITVAGTAYTAKNIMIATGSSVTQLPGVAVDQKVIVDSTGALLLPKVPKHMVVIGGGVIGLELGSVWRRLGAQVTVVEYLDQILPGMDGEVRKEAAKIFAKQGFTIRTSTKVTGAAVKGGKAILTVEPAAGGASETIEADCVLVSIGRRPNTEGLGLDKAGITLNKRGQIEVGPDFQTNIPGIYAIGDVTPGPMLAHKAEDEGIAAAEFIAGGTGIVNHAVIPGVVYTMPEIADVGLTEEEAKERAKEAGNEIKVGKFPFMANSRAKTNRDTDGFVKVIADAKTDKVLGVHIIGSLAGTMIAEAALAMEFGATSEDIAYTCHAHPTHSEAMKEAAMAVTGKPIHM